MFKESKALFLYSLSPVHVGSGDGLGLIDNPIQRERHTDHPVFPGSGLKGAVRHRLSAQCTEDDAGLISRIMGPKDGDPHAGAVSFSDAQLVAFPVRSICHAYVHVTSPTVLARTLRQLSAVGEELEWTLPQPAPGECAVVSAERYGGGQLILEAYEYQMQEDEGLRGMADWLADRALPSGNAHAYFKQKLQQDLVVLPDEDFSHFIRTSTTIEPHVRINDVTGTADDGGLFYTENLPPETLMLATLNAGDEQSGRSDGMSAETMLNTLLSADPPYGLDTKIMQIGGDATTGRGQVVVSVVGD